MTKHNLVQPSKEEERNGWTAETLTEYIKSREKVQHGIIISDPYYRGEELPDKQNNDYNPFKWR